MSVFKLFDNNIGDKTAYKNELAIRELIAYANLMIKLIKEHGYHGKIKFNNGNLVLSGDNKSDSNNTIKIYNRSESILYSYKIGCTTQNNIRYFTFCKFTKDEKDNKFYSDDENGIFRSLGIMTKTNNKIYEKLEKTIEELLNVYLDDMIEYNIGPDEEEYYEI